MASQKVENDPKYKQLQEERDLFEQKYLELKKKYDALAAKHNEETSDDDPEDLNPPAKKQKVINEDDPFEFLPPELGDKIRSYLTPKELLEAMRISTAWKHFIGSRESRMKRVMNNIKLKLDSKSLESYKGLKVNLSINNERGYKHLETDVAITITKTIQLPIANYASTLVTLKINQHITNNLELQPAHFPQLKKLSFLCTHVKKIVNYSPPCFTIKNFIFASSFPEVTHLRLQFVRNDALPLGAGLSKFPKLIFLAIENNAASWPSLRYKSFITRPKLEVIFISDYFNYQSSFFIAFKDTLKEVHLENVTRTQLITMLETLENLETFSVHFMEEDDEEFSSLPRNEKVRTLMIVSTWCLELCKDLIRAVSSLKYLNILSNLNNDGLEVMKILVDHMANLKKLTCRGLNNEAMDYYNDMKKVENQLGNTNFEIVIEPRDNNEASQWKEYREKFYENNFE